MKTEAIFPSLSELPDLCRSALVSLVYNRGDNISNSDRRREMKNIHKLLEVAKSQGFATRKGKSNLILIEDEFVKMKRHWPLQSGLIQRRQNEANLWRHGLRGLS